MQHVIAVLTFLLRVQVYTRSEDVQLQGCKIEEVAGFLKYKCPQLGKAVQYQCHNSEENYVFLNNYVYEGQLCSNDPHSYQACDKRLFGFKITNNELLCGNWMCITKKIPPSIFVASLAFSTAMGYVCDNIKQCEDNRDESNCNGLSTLLSGAKTETNKICNDICDTIWCEDEAVCSGLTYGIYCKRTTGASVNQNYYVPQLWICDNATDCDAGEDEINCTVTVQTKDTCMHFRTEAEIPIFNYTRCGVIRTFISASANNYCKSEELKKYQTNCTDPARVGGFCYVDGFLSTVSKYVVCYVAYGTSEVMLCDDDIQSQCVNPSKSCTNIHKHSLCDRKSDCIDESDENHPSCHHQTTRTCKRKIGKARELTLPLTWIGDGIQDCVDGEDEMEIWPTCGTGKTHRLVTSNKTCQNVLLCLSGDPGYIELSDLCDGHETCGNENEICLQSRGSQAIPTTVFSTEQNLVKQLYFCLKGLQNLHNLANNYCAKELFIFPDQQYFGVNTKTSLFIPNSSLDCDHVYGEQYVFSSCTNKCDNSACPLRNWPRYEVCPSQYPKRIGTIANNEYLAFFTKSHESIFTNRYFVCDNKVKCVEYSQVCNLVDDCDDGSDEKACTNHFKCNSSDRLIPKTKKCDGKYDCLDMSDECNEQCSREILEGSFLKAISMVIGILAVLANLIVMMKNLKTLKRCTSSVALANESLITLISFGDFLVGCYLLVIVIYDTVVFKRGYCHQQIKWMTSFECSTIGFLSTIGSQMSLFAMAGLSTVRLKGIRGPLRVPSEVNLVKSLKVGLAILILLLISIAIAITPIISTFENFFVNGIRFADEIKLFIGPQNKLKIHRVLEAYYGRMKDTTLSWDMIRKMISDMFSHDAGYEDLAGSVTKQDFYGNDGVCLFKYFVSKNDPQKDFVWAILVVNFVCFLFISISYVLIGVVSRDSSRNLASSQNKSHINQRNRNMNRRITIIITTDFCCWVPFIVICALHYLEVLDATPWYSIFSMTILPINSVINPLLYDDFITRLMKAPLLSILTNLVNSSTYQSIRSRFSTITTISPEIVEREMELIHVREDGNGCVAAGNQIG